MTIDELRTASEAREFAARQYADAQALVEGKDAHDLDDDTFTRFDALMADGAKADERYVALAGKEGKVATLRERLDYYSTRATGSGIPWQRVVTTQPDPPAGKSIGDQFVNSEEYKGLVGSRALDSDNAPFKTSPFHPETKAATDVLHTNGPGDALMIPQYLPGILPYPQRQLTVRNLFSQDTTNTDVLSYAQQTSFDNAATPVLEATTLATGLKPQSSIAWTRKTAPIEAIATWMAATRKQLSDVGQTRSLIDNQLRVMLQLVEEDQLLNGNGTSPNLRGLLSTAGLQTLVLTAVTGPFVNIDGLRDAIRLVKTGTAFAEPDGIVMHPIDAAKLDEAKDTTSRYLGQGPFGGANPTVWRKPVIESMAVASGTAIVGAFNFGATVFQREGIVILASDSHADFFIRNLVAVLAEERLGLAVFWPTAFCVVTLKATGWSPT